MKNEITNLLEFVGLASRLVDVIIEVTEVISSKAADFEENGVIKALADAMKTQMTVLESEIAVLQRELEKTYKNANEAGAREDRAKVLFSPHNVTANAGEQTEFVEEGDSKVFEPAPTEDDGAFSVAVSADAEDEEAGAASGGEGTADLFDELHKGAFADLSEDEVEAAVFPRAIDKTVFIKAISEMTSADATLRVDAAKALAGVRHELSVRVLAEQLGRDHSAQVRQECVRSLASLRMSEGIAAVETAMTDEAAQVRLAAVWSLYQLAGAESVPSLMRTLSDEDEEVRRRAVTCIEWLARERKTAGMIGNTDSRLAISAVVRCLEDPEKSVREAALGALEAVTGKKMKRASTKGDKNLHQDTIAQWKKWWRKELLG